MILWSRRHQVGFTLLELMVAISVLAMLLIIMMSIVDSATRLWRQSEHRVDSYREARAAINLIVSDLKSLYAAPDRTLFKFDSTKSELNFLTRIPSDFQDSGNRSELCEVGYRRRYARITPTAKESFNLYRSFLGSNDTFSNIQNKQSFSGGGTEELLARNIADFEIKAYTINPDTGAMSDFNQSAKPFPDLLTVRLTALNHNSASRFKSQGDWSDKNSQTYKENARTFTARVLLQSSPANDPVPTPSPTPTTE